MNGFEIAAGTVGGAHHVRVGRNNQDSWAVQQTASSLVAVVTDGCSESADSEVGAKIGSRLIAGILTDFLAAPGGFPADHQGQELFLEAVRHQALQKIELFAQTMTSDQPTNDVQVAQMASDFQKVKPGNGGRCRSSNELTEALARYFLFTIVGVAVSDERFFTFSLGDGYLVLNGETLKIGPFPQNQPPYLAYGLLKRDSEKPLASSFSIHQSGLAKTIDSMVIATDGLDAFLKNAGKPLPGRQELLGPLSQFWTSEFYFQNTDGIRRRLFLANHASSKPDWEQRRLVREEGLLGDDTTVIVLRRCSNSKKGA